MINNIITTSIRSSRYSQSIYWGIVIGGIASSREKAPIIVRGGIRKNTAGSYRGKKTGKRTGKISQDPVFTITSLVPFECCQFAVMIFDKQDRPAIDRACLRGFLLLVQNRSCGKCSPIKRTYFINSRGKEL